MEKMILRLFGLYTAIIFFSCNGANNHTDAPTQDQVKPISYSVIKSFPHDTSSFTQGLVFYKGSLYEGTGGSDSNHVGSKLSRLMQIDLQSGKALKTIPLSGKYFGEGITILNDTVYQLTWREHKVFIYTLPDFKKIKEFTINTEGWGITHNGKELIVSDGTSNLYFYDPATFTLLRTQSVTLNSDVTYNLNELEYIDGYVYANQWEQPYIFKIDPESGQIVGRIDLTQLWNRAKSIDSAIDDMNYVPNGIAYDADTKKIYVTGKKWPELYEIQLTP